jgi:hypothetical protein
LEETWLNEIGMPLFEKLDDAFRQLGRTRPWRDGREGIRRDAADGDRQARRRLYLAWPLRDTARTFRRVVLPAFRTGLPTAAERACFDLATLVCVEAEPTMSAGQSLRTNQLERSYIRRTFAARFHFVWAEFLKHYPALASLKPRISPHPTQFWLQWHGWIDGLKVECRALDTGGQFLGIAYEPAIRRAARGGRAVNLPERASQVFERLLASQDTPVSKDSLGTLGNCPEWHEVKPQVVSSPELG